MMTGGAPIYIGNLHIWLVVYLPLWKIWKLVGMIIPNIWTVIKAMFQSPPTRYGNPQMMINHDILRLGLGRIHYRSVIIMMVNYLYWWWYIINN